MIKHDLTNFKCIKWWQVFPIKCVKNNHVKIKHINNNWINVNEKVTIKIKQNYMNLKEFQSNIRSDCL